MATGFACYHHCNDHDRAAVSTCSKCGKALCAECTDLFRSRKTGQILCVECLNNEIAANERLAASIMERDRKQIIGMIVGLVVGFILAIIMAASAPEIGFLGFIYFPFLIASFGTIWMYSFGSFGFVFGLIAFIGMMLISPIMFVIRIVKRVKERKQLAEIIAYNIKARKLNNEYLEYARSCKSGLSSADLQRIIFLAEQTEKKEKALAEQLNKAMASGASDSEIAALKKEWAETKQKVQDMQNQVESGGAQQAEKNAEFDAFMRAQSATNEDNAAMLNKMAHPGKKAS